MSKKPPEYSRYNILGAKALANAKNEKVAAKILFDIVGLEAEKYRLGHTKVFAKLRVEFWDLASYNAFVFRSI